MWPRAAVLDRAAASFDLSHVLFQLHNHLLEHGFMSVPHMKHAHLSALSVPKGMVALFVFSLNGADPNTAVKAHLGKGATPDTLEQGLAMQKERVCVCVQAIQGRFQRALIFIVTCCRSRFPPPWPFGGDAHHSSVRGGFGR